MAESGNAFEQLVDELKRRKVFRVAIAYLALAWLIAQISDLVLENFDAPGWIIKTILYLLAIGFPAVVFLAWVFELTPEGVKYEREDEASDVRAKRPGGVQVRYFVLLGVMSLAVAYFAIDKFWTQDPAVSVPGAVPVEAQQQTYPSIAVLPFVNMSSDPENEFFSDGLSEEILNLLANHAELTVIGRTSSFAFKGQSKNILEIGQLLGVAAVLDGSVRKSGDQVRVTAQLIDTADSASIWSQTYNRTMTEIFTVQDELAAEIIAALNVQLGQAPTRERPTANGEAYTLFLKARVLVNEFDFQQAMEILNQAIALDPDFAEAHELLAFCYWYIGGSDAGSAGGQRAAGEAATRALAINPDLVFAQALDKAANTVPYSFRVEIEAFERVLARQPDNTWALGGLIFRLMETGYLDEAVVVAQRLAELDPLSPIAHQRLHEALYAAGRTEESLEVLQTAADLDSPYANWTLAHIYLAEGRDDEAIEQLEIYLQRNGYPDGSWVRGLIESARDPQNGLANLKAGIADVLASTPEELEFELRNTLIMWYLFFGYLDEQYDRLFEYELTDQSWTDVDVPLWQGTVFRRLGFTAHPRYLQLVEALGMTRAWDERGAPDYCDRVDGQWRCE